MTYLAIDPSKTVIKIGTTENLVARNRNLRHKRFGKMKMILFCSDPSGASESELLNDAKGIASPIEGREWFPYSARIIEMFRNQGAITFGGNLREDFVTIRNVDTDLWKRFKELSKKKGVLLPVAVARALSAELERMAA